MMQLNTQNTVKSDNYHKLNKELEEKTEEMLCMENLFQTLIYKERMCNDELQDARKEAIRVCVTFVIRLTRLISCNVCKVLD